MVRGRGAQAAGQRNLGADDAADPRHQLAAVDVEAVGQNKHAGKVVGPQRAPERFAVVARPLRIVDVLPAHFQPRGAEADGGGDDRVVVDVVIVDLAAGAAAHDMGIGK
jgi:hypothetical protein